MEHGKSIMINYWADSSKISILYELEHEQLQFDTKHVGIWYHRHKIFLKVYSQCEHTLD